MVSSEAIEDGAIDSSSGENSISAKSVYSCEVRGAKKIKRYLKKKKSLPCLLTILGEAAGDSVCKGPSDWSASGYCGSGIYWGLIDSGAKKGK